MTQTQTTQPTIVPKTEPKHHIVEVSTDQLRDILFARVGSSFVSCEAKYDMDKTGKMLKGGRGNTPANPWLGQGLVKLATTFGAVTFDFGAAVKRRLEKEGKAADEHQKGESWSQAVIRDDGSLTPLSVHKADINADGSFKPFIRTYLRLRYDKSDSRYELPDGSIVDKKELAPWLPKPKSYKNQGLDSPVKFITVAFDSLLSLTIDGVKYLLRH